MNCSDLDIPIIGWLVRLIFGCSGCEQADC
jgi:hypothetical protein